jgi:C-terminal processing protease CtpA/Prc
MKTILIFFLSWITIASYSQEYNIERLKDISIIWGETYLFHPSVIRADMNIEWEKQLVNFLPGIKNELTHEEFIGIINTELLSVLDDPFTRVQLKEYESFISPFNLENSNEVQYIRITESELSDYSLLIYLDSLISDRSSLKPLVIDVRIENLLVIDQHSFTPLDYFASMLLKESIPMSLNVSREHFGWDEYNDWWLYEQRWKVAVGDKQIAGNGRIMTFEHYQQGIQQLLPENSFNNFTPIQRPVYFITNNSIRFYYENLLSTLASNRPGTYVINEDTGPIFETNPDLKKYTFNNFEFILNLVSRINPDYSVFKPITSYAKLNETDIISFIKSSQVEPDLPQYFSFEIAPPGYNSSNEKLSKEEKILGVIKVWTIVKYFYTHPDKIGIDWESSLGKYLERGLETENDRDYYMLIQEWLSHLNDSHVSTYHPSIVDFSELFVAPIKFEWIEGKVIITAIDSSLESTLAIGDEILSIDGNPIHSILESEKQRISTSNNQGLISVIINPGFFIGKEGSVMKLAINKGDKVESIAILRNTYVFGFLGSGDNRPARGVLDGNIGYLNLAAINDPDEIENELVEMAGTRGLIIDLRNSYPHHDYRKFLQMLCSEKTTVRIDEVPVVSGRRTMDQFVVNKTIIEPGHSFSYVKPIAVLVDKTMISRPEDIAMSLKAFSNVFFVGEQTQGTNGEVTKINLPGGGETSFTGQVVKFGNGGDFQGIGIIPDVKVTRTLKGVIEEKDEILEKAIEIMKKNGKQ